MPPCFASRRWRTRGSRSHSNDGGRLSYAELDALSDRFAAGLRASGLPPGERVAVQVPNIPQFLVAYFGTLKAECVAVPLNVLLKAPELAYCLDDAQAQALVTWAGVVDGVTIFEGVPTMYVAVLRHPSLAAYDVSTLRTSDTATRTAPTSSSIARRT